MYQSMQPVLERGSIDKPLTVDVGLIQLSFIPVCSATFQSNCTEGLHFSAFTSVEDFNVLMLTACKICRFVDCLDL